MKASIGCDHAAYELKNEIASYLESKGIEVEDRGCFSSESADYADYAHKVARDVTSGEADFGILMCGSGNGISMAANKWPGVRAALCWSPEIANMARLHNDANILSMPARYISLEDAKKCVDEFVETKFEGGRHAKRIEKIPFPSEYR